VEDDYLFQKNKKTEYLADVTHYPERTYGIEELKKIEASLSKKLAVLTAMMEKLSKNSNAGYSALYKKIKDEGTSKTAIISKMQEHRLLNRYANIVAYDDSRVKVTANAGNNNTDYVNANYIDAYGRKNGYIASQGPTPATTASFWQMVWEQKTELIVMVTNLLENGKLKCHRYWPHSKGSNVRYGDYGISFKDEENYPTYVARHFVIENLTNKKEKKRDVSHFQYIVWPDHGVPDTSVEMLKFRAMVKPHYGGKKAGPVVVHCSAGVGRTGTFIGLDRYLDACADLNNELAILDIVKNMRQSRNWMVQAEAQFVYLYEAAAEGLLKLKLKVEREVKFYYMSGQEKKTAILKDVEFELATEGRKFKMLLHMDHRLGFNKSADTRSGLPETTYKADISTASDIQPVLRMQSLAMSTDQWLERHNVPLSPGEHGYAIRAAALDTRIGALSDARTHWMKTYAEAEKTWQSQQDLEGVMYEVGHQLTPIESRVMSLAAAEASWRVRGNGQVDVYTAMRAEQLRTLDLRLTSLEYTVKSSDQRWKDRGAGFRTAADPKLQLSASNTEHLGALEDRLHELQKDTTAWLGRDNWEAHTKQKFLDHVDEVGVKQETIEKERAAVLAKIESDQASEKAENTRINAKIEEKRAQDAFTSREKAKGVERIQASAQTPKEYLPHTEQENRKKAKQAVVDSAMEKKMAALKMKEQEKEAKEAKKNETNMAKGKASKFIRKMSSK